MDPAPACVGGNEGGLGDEVRELECDRHAGVGVCGGGVRVEGGVGRAEETRVVVVSARGRHHEVRLLKHEHVGRCETEVAVVKSGEEVDGARVRGEAVHVEAGDVDH